MWRSPRMSSRSHQARHVAAQRAVERVGRVARFRRQVGEAGVACRPRSRTRSAAGRAASARRRRARRAGRGEQQAAVFVRRRDPDVDLVPLEQHQDAAQRAMEHVRRSSAAPRCIRSRAPGPPRAPRRRGPRPAARRGAPARDASMPWSSGAVRGSATSMKRVEDVPGAAERDRPRLLAEDAGGAAQRRRPRAAAAARRSPARGPRA